MFILLLWHQLILHKVGLSHFVYLSEYRYWFHGQNLPPSCKVMSAFVQKGECFGHELNTRIHRDMKYGLKLLGVMQVVVTTRKHHFDVVKVLQMYLRLNCLMVHGTYYVNSPLPRDFQLIAVAEVDINNTVSPLWSIIDQSLSTQQTKCTHPHKCMTTWLLWNYHPILWTAQTLLCLMQDPIEIWRISSPIIYVNMILISSRLQRRGRPMTQRIPQTPASWPRRDTVSFTYLGPTDGVGESVFYTSRI